MDWRLKVPRDVLTTMIVDGFAERGVTPAMIVVGGRVRFTESFTSASTFETFPGYVQPWTVVDIAAAFDRIEKIAIALNETPIAGSLNVARPATKAKKQKR